MDQDILKKIFSEMKRIETASDQICDKVQYIIGYVLDEMNKNDRKDLLKMPEFTVTKTSEYEVNKETGELIKNIDL